MKEEKNMVDRKEKVVEKVVPVRSKSKIRVCAYCRVSTGLESQETSVESQRIHYESYIRANPAWDYAGVYLEVGVSGTKTESRLQLQRLIADCKAGKIDLILTKSISRFARNTSDCLEMVRLLASLGVSIHFEKEQIHTDSMYSELMLSILACLAEDESHSISRNMKWAIRCRFADGTYLQAIAPYGYSKKREKMILVPKEACVVKEIFAMSLSGMGSPMIARKLNERPGRRWNAKTIQEMLKNPVYKGDTLYQKSFKDEEFCRRINHGELDRYYNKDHHEAIISREIFGKTQRVIRQRARAVGYDGEEQKRSSNRYCFTGILYCKECGSVMHRQRRANGIVSWQCMKHVRFPDQCGMKPQGDEDLKRAFINCLNKIAWSQRGSAGILDVYEALTRKSQAQKNADNLSPLGKEMNKNQNEITKQEKIIGRLRAFSHRWKRTADPASFPEDAFSEYVASCMVMSKKTVDFYFRCGMKLTESLHREEQEGKNE